MEKTKLYSLLKRFLTALVLVPVTIWCLYAGYPFAQIFALAFGAMFSWEWSYMVPNKRPAFYAMVYMFVVSVAVMLGSLLVFFAVLFVSSLLVWRKSGDEQHRRLLTLGVPYVSVGIGSIMWVYEFVGYWATLWFFLAVWCVDIGGYVVGCTLKGPKLAPKISPNKTWSGLLGGVAFSVSASLAFCYYTKVTNHYGVYGAVAAFVAVIAQIGDLVESSIKRHLGIKDSSQLIPGHGGVFDRIDGLVFAAPIVLGLLCFFSRGFGYGLVN